MATDTPSPSDLQSRLRRAKTLNVILAAISAFLLIVVVAQLATGKTPNSKAVADQSASQSAPVESGEAAANPETEETQSGSSETPAAEGNGVGVETRDPNDPMAIGDVNAPVVMVEWTDLRCPYCALFARDTFPTLIQEYVDTGKVRIEVRDVAFFGEQSEDAAVAARAAGAQGKFFEYIEAVYQAAPESGHADLPRETLIAFAEQVGVPDMAKFEVDMDDETLRTAVQVSTTSAQQLGVNSVPFFAVGSSALAGAQPLEVFQQFLDDALSKAE